MRMSAGSRPPPEFPRSTLRPIGDLRAANGTRNGELARNGTLRSPPSTLRSQRKPTDPQIKAFSMTEANTWLRFARIVERPDDEASKLATLPMQVPYIAA
jgi:hypothetical protein